MCGIAGLLRFSGPADTLSAEVERMSAALTHRGPDAGANWTDPAAGIALGHRRLSILDLSTAGAQPMHSASGRFVVAFNGEIYNHGEIRTRLENVTWRGHSDTEVLLAAIEAWGLFDCLRRLVGMFAFALWDRERHELVLARDRLGEKPLYYGWLGHDFGFASELKAFASNPLWHGEIDREALTLFLRLGYVPVPRTIWRGLYKLAPGSYLAIPTAATVAVLPAPTFYWRAAEVVNCQPRSDLGEQEAADALEAHLGESLAGQMLADVPLGAFLSGGVDSSTVVALMQARSTRPVRTFTIGFSESDYDESAHARRIARHLGTDHCELMLAPADARAVIPRLPELYDEPFADSSQIPTYLVAAMARSHVSVCLSGDGGDELFAGYNRHVVGAALWRHAGHLPRSLRVVAANVLHGVSPQTWDALGQRLPRRLQQPTPGDRLHKLGDALRAADEDDLYLGFISQIREPEALVIGGSAPATWAEREAAAFVAGERGGEFTERMMFCDLVGYLSDDILVKVDRAAMATSLETRVPLLDHRLVEFAWSLPLNMKVRDGQGKWLLRQVLYRHVPREMIERPKQGFAVPIDAWLRGPLRDWAEALLDEARMRREGLLNPAPIRLKWQEHLSGRRNWQHWLWNVLMFQAWRERWA
jgi:asparagine synthase (glutamine-hydrolysing)